MFTSVSRKTLGSTAILYMSRPMSSCSFSNFLISGYSRKMEPSAGWLCFRLAFVMTRQSCFLSARRWKLQGQSILKVLKREKLDGPCAHLVLKEIKSLSITAGPLCNAFQRKLFIPESQEICTHHTKQTGCTAYAFATVNLVYDDLCALERLEYDCSIHCIQFWY